MSKRKVFISHRHKDRDWVERFSRSLSEKGWTAWSGMADPDLANVNEKVEKALRTSDAIVLVPDHGEEQSPWMLFELGAAIAMGKIVVAVVPEDFDMERVPNVMRTRSSQVKSTPEETALDLVDKIAA